jgi:hypothetical protein
MLRIGQQIFEYRLYWSTSERILPERKRKRHWNCSFLPQPCGIVLEGNGPRRILFEEAHFELL